MDCKKNLQRECEFILTIKGVGDCDVSAAAMITDGWQVSVVKR